MTLVATSDSALVSISSAVLSPAASLADARRTLVVTHKGGGAELANITVSGAGVGNYDGFRGTAQVRLLPGLSL